MDSSTHSAPDPGSSRIEDWLQVDATHYNPINYLQPARMASIGYQFHLLHQHFPTARVLEIGAGPGLAAAILRQLGHEVSVLDIDENLNPDIIGSVTNVPSSDDSYDAFLCCQVLEHLPWDSAKLAMRELARVVQLGGVLSVPTMRPCIGIAMHAWNRKGTRTIPLPSFRKPKMRSPAYHYWELSVGVTKQQFVDGLHQAGLNVVFDFQPVLNLYHHFFVVKKR